MPTKTYDEPVLSNHDAWFAVRDARRDGLAVGDIAARTGISYRMVVVYAAQPRPARILRRLNAHRRTPLICACGRLAPIDGYTRCGRCARAAQVALADHEGREVVLLTWAEDHGRVPSCEDAQCLLAVGRSVAGDEILRVFGPDHRDGRHRLTSYRGWPAGAPDVPRPEMVEQVRRALVAAHARRRQPVDTGALR